MLRAFRRLAQGSLVSSSGGVSTCALAQEDRALLRLFYLEELSVAETAEALHIPMGTVKSRLFHARQRLRRALERRST